MNYEQQIRRDLLDSICEYGRAYECIEFIELDKLQALERTEFVLVSRLDIISKFLPSQLNDEVFPAHIAAAVGTPEILLMFEEQFGEVSKTKHVTTLMFALLFGRVDNAEIILKKIPELFDKVTADGLTTLQCGLFGSVGLEFIQSQKLGGAPGNGRTELMYAAMGGSAACVNTYQSQVNQCDNNGYTALMFAAHFGRGEAVNLLLEEARKQEKLGLTALMFAVQNNNLQISELLSQLELKLQNKQGYSALMIACQYPNAEIALLLIEEAGLQNMEGETSLMMALDNFEDLSTNVVQSQVLDALILVEAGKQTSAKQYSALMVAAQNGDLASVEKLLDSEQKLTDANGNMAVNYAISADSFDCFDKLLPIQGNRTNCQQLIEFCKLFGFDEQIKKINNHLDELDQRMKAEQDALFD